MPHRHSHVLADVERGSAAHVDQAIAAALEARRAWSETPWHERAAVFLRAAELLAGPWRTTLNAATMLNQSKTAYQAEIDAACESIDFLRFNVDYLTRIYAEQPVSSPGVWNRLEYRPLEGFVFAISPFNFTAIGANLTTSPALDGEHGRVEARVDPGALCLVHAADPRRGRPSARRDQPRVRRRRRAGQRRTREPRPRRRSLHRLHRRVPVDLEDDRHRNRRLPQLSPDRRRDRRQGLHPRASLCRC